MEKYKVIYSPKFWPRLNDILLYLTNKWSAKIADDFLDIFEDKIALLIKNPKTGRKSLKNSTIRSIPITKHNRLYYQVKDNLILIITIFDTRQDPSKNLFE
jgi:plasmid stabilization system protein ParE